MTPDEHIDEVARRMTTLERAPGLAARVSAQLDGPRRWDWRWVVVPAAAAALLAVIFWLPRTAREPAPRQASVSNEPAEALVPESATTAASGSAMSEVPPVASRSDATVAGSESVVARRSSTESATAPDLEDELAGEEASVEPMLAEIPVLPPLPEPDPIVMTAVSLEAVSVPALEIEPMSTRPLVIEPLAADQPWTADKPWDEPPASGSL
jgi:hypothetical protein